MELVLFIGIQATGKSTFYSREYADTHMRINLDMLKTRHREKLLVEACLEAKQPFVVDNTNPTIEDRSRYIGPARNAGFSVVGYYFSSPISEALERNSQRAESKRVPDAGVRGAYSRLKVPTFSEGFDRLSYVRINEDGGFLVEEWNDEV